MIINKKVFLNATIKDVNSVNFIYNKCRHLKLQTALIGRYNAIFPVIRKTHVTIWSVFLATKKSHILVKLIASESDSMFISQAAEQVVLRTYSTITFLIAAKKIRKNHSSMLMPS